MDQKHGTNSQAIAGLLKTFLQRNLQYSGACFIEIRYNLEESKFAIRIQCRENLSEIDILMIKRLAINDITEEVRNNEIFDVLKSLAHNFPNITIKFKRDSSLHFLLTIKDQEIVDYKDIDGSDGENGLTVILKSGNELNMSSIKTLQNVIKDLALVHYNASFKMTDINTEESDFCVDSVNTLAQQISKLRDVKFHDIFHDTINNGKFSMEICIFVPSILASRSKPCEHLIYLNGKFNKELSEHLYSHLKERFKYVNFIALITSQESDLKGIKGDLYSFSIELLSILKENEAKTMKKDDIHFVTEPVKPTTVKEKPYEGRRLRSRAINVDDDEEVEIDLTEDPKRSFKEKDDFLEVDRDNEDIFYEMVSSGDVKCDCDIELFQLWHDNLSPDKIPEEDIELEVDSHSPGTSNLAAIPALSQIQHSYGDSDILEISDEPVPKKQPVQRTSERKTRMLPDIFKRVENNMKVINQEAKQKSIADRLRSGSIKSNLFNQNELQSYGRKMKNATPWRRENTPPAEVIVLDSPEDDRVIKPKNGLLANYKIPKVKHDVDKQASVYNGECSKNVSAREILIPIEKSPNNFEPGTSLGSRITIPSQIEDPGLGNSLDLSFLTQKERAYYESEKDAELVRSRRKLADLSRSNYENSNRGDSIFDWNDQPNQKEVSPARNMLTKVTDFFAGLSGKKSFKNSSSSNNNNNNEVDVDDDVSIIAVNFPNSHRDSQPTTSTSLSPRTTEDNGKKSYGIFTSKNTRTSNQHEISEVIEVQDGSDHEETRSSSRDRHYRRDRDSRRYTDSNGGYRSSRRERSRSRDRSNGYHRSRSSYYHHDDRSRYSK